MPEKNPEEDEKAKLSSAGCVLALLDLAIIFGVAIPIVHWRDPESGQPLPRMIAIFTPVLIGALFHGICEALLRLVGLAVWLKPEQDAPSRPQE